MLLDAFLHLHAIGFDLLLASVASLHTIGDSLLLLCLFGLVGCFGLFVDLGHFNFDVYIVVEQRLQLDPGLAQKANRRVPHRLDLGDEYRPCVSEIVDRFNPGGFDTDKRIDEHTTDLHGYIAGDVNELAQSNESLLQKADRIIPTLLNCSGQNGPPVGHEPSVAFHTLASPDKALISTSPIAYAESPQTSEI